MISFRIPTRPQPRFSLTSCDHRRAEQLIGGLGDERERWQESAERLAKDLKNLVGNVMLASGCLAYLGPFTSQFRKVYITLLGRDGCIAFRIESPCIMKCIVWNACLCMVCGKHRKSSEHPQYSIFEAFPAH